MLERMIVNRILNNSYDYCYLLNYSILRSEEAILIDKEATPLQIPQQMVIMALPSKGNIEGSNRIWQQLKFGKLIIYGLK